MHQQVSDSSLLDRAGLTFTLNTTNKKALWTALIAYMCCLTTANRFILQDFNDTFV